MDFYEGDLVRVNSYYKYSDLEKGFSLGLVLDVDPSEDGPTYYLLSVPGSEPDWYHEDSIFSMQQVPDVP